MKLTRDLAYDAPVDAVLAMLHDPAFWDRVAEATGAPSSSTTVRRDGDVVTVVTDQLQDVVGVPGFAKKLVGDSTRAINTQAWRGAQADVTIETPGKPTAIAGTARVEASGAGSVLRYDLDVRASVPLIGGKLERLVCDLTGAGLDTEHGVGRDWLSTSS